MVVTHSWVPGGLFDLYPNRAFGRRSFRLPRRPGLGEHPIVGHDQERATLPGLTQESGQISPELARADTSRRLACL
jgi:hypothetical protein